MDCTDKKNSGNLDLNGQHLSFCCFLALGRDESNKREKEEREQRGDKSEQKEKEKKQEVETEWWKELERASSDEELTHQSIFEIILGHEALHDLIHDHLLQSSECLANVFVKMLQVTHYSQCLPIWLFLHQRSRPFRICIDQRVSSQMKAFHPIDSRKDRSGRDLT